LYATLYAGKEVTVYFEKFSTKKDAPQGNVVVYSKGPLFEPYTKIDYAKKQVFMYDMIAKKILLIEDNYIVPVWEITDESKVVAEYKCLKAKTTFRGREWIVWFAPDIPVPFGPWKLHGLPGLILESCSADNRYCMQAVKIEFKRDAILDKDFATLYAADNDKPITYQKYLKDYQEFLDNTRARVMAGRKDITPLPSPPSKTGREIDFEWDNK
jgi:GLPGLI family protein